MFCSQCGEPSVEGAKFCSSCGAALEAPDETNTTASLDPGMMDPTAQIEGGTPLDAGVGMLVVVRGPIAGSRFLLDRDVTTIGRHPDSDVWLDDVTVSRHHAEVRREGGGFVLVDLDSLNGTYVGGQRKESAPLSAGVELQIGRFKLMFAEGPA